MSFLDSFRRKAVEIKDKYVQQLEDVKAKREKEGRPLFEEPIKKTETQIEPELTPQQKRLAQLKQPPAFNFNASPLARAIDKNFEIASENILLHSERFSEDPSVTKGFRLAWSMGIEPAFVPVISGFEAIGEGVPGGKLITKPIEFFVDKAINPFVEEGLKPLPNEPKLLTDIKQDVLSPIFKTVLIAAFFKKTMDVSRATRELAPSIGEGIMYKNELIPQYEVKLVAQKVASNRPLSKREQGIADILQKFEGRERGKAVRGKIEVKVKVPRNFFKNIKERWKKVTGEEMPPEVFRLVERSTKAFPESYKRMEVEFNTVLDRMETGLTRLKPNRTPFAGERFVFLDSVKPPKEIIPQEPKRDKLTRVGIWKPDVAITTGLAESVEARAIQEGLTKGFSGLAGFDPITLKDQAEKVDALIKSNEELAKKIAFGLEEAPQGIKPISVWKGVEIKAKKEADVDTLSKLASSKLTTAISESAQNLSILQDRDPESPVTAMRDVAKVRERVVQRRMKGKSIKAEKNIIKKEIKKEIKKANTPTSWTAFIESIKC